MREMVDIDLPWIEQIPKEWSTKRIKEFLSERKETCLAGDGYQLLAVSEYYGVAPKKDVIKEGEQETRAESVEGYKICRPGDLAMNIMLAWRRAMGVSDYLGIISPSYAVFQPKKGIQVNMKFFHYLFRTDVYAKYFEGNSTGIMASRWRLYPDVFLSLRCQFPPIDVQSRIVSYLDDRCAKIDEAIERHDTLIKKLDEYRKAVITEAVTKGVRGKREMKESGVVWIKEIPFDWTYKPLKAIFTFGKGLSITKANLVEKGFPVISYGQVHAKYNSGVSVCDELIRYVSKDDICESSLVKNNDLIFADTSEDLEGCGNCVYVNTDYPIYGGYHTIVLNSRFEQSNKFIAYLVKTDDWRFQLRRQLTEVKLYSVSQKVLKDTTVILPPLMEQQEIVAYLDEKCAAIDAAKERHAQLMAKLEEYKKSLIYYAVTGKIEC